MTEDDDLLAALRRAAGEADPVPELVTRSARAAFETRRLDEELLELLHDSDIATPVATRGVTAGPRLLSYESGEVSLELQVRSGEDGVVVRGVVIGATGDIQLEPANAASTWETPDEDGWFVATLPSTPFRVRVTTSTGVAVSTGWISP